MVTTAFLLGLTARVRGHEGVPPVIAPDAAFRNPVSGLERTGARSEVVAVAGKALEQPVSIQRHFSMRLPSFRAAIPCASCATLNLPSRCNGAFRKNPVTRVRAQRVFLALG